MTRIMVFGTFDPLHPGHEDFFRQARSLAEDAHLIVSVARDVNVARVKGTPPRYSEDKRLQAVSAHPLVDEATLGDADGCLVHVCAARPVIVALGYDQSGEYVEALEEAIREGAVRVRVVRTRAFHPDIYKSSLIKGAV